MNNPIQYFIVISIIALILLGGAVFVGRVIYSQIDIYQKYGMSINTTPNNTTVYIGMDKINGLLDSITEFAGNNTYNETTFNCQNYSAEAVKLAQAQGFNVKLAIGCDNDSCHEWIKLILDIEPQDGVFVDYSHVYNQSYREIIP